MTLVPRYINPDYDSPVLRRLCAAPDTEFTDRETLIKDDNTTTLRRATVDGVELVIKRYNTKNPWHRIRRNFQKTRASNCRHMAAEFIELGIAVPDSVAVIEERFGPLSGRSWYVSEYVDSEMLLDYLAVDDWQARYAQLVDRIIEIFGILRRNRLSHGDMKATNWLVRQGELLLIDLDATHRHRSAQSHRRALLKDRARFLKNWDNQPSLRAQFAQRLDEAGI